MSPSPFVLLGSPSSPATPTAIGATHLSLIRLLCMFAVSFSYGLVFNTVNNIVVPNEIERLTTSRQSMWVGLIMASGALSQFATPIAGAWSDKSGDRIRFLLGGSLVTVCGVMAFSVVSSSQSVLLLFVSQIITTVGLSVQYAMVTALLNDYVPLHQAGAGSGALAILGILGSAVGYGLFALNIPSQYSFMCYIGCTIGCVAISTFFIPAKVTAPKKRSNSSVPSPSNSPPQNRGASGGATTNRESDTRKTSDARESPLQGPQGSPSPIITKRLTDSQQPPSLKIVSPSVPTPSAAQPAIIAPFRRRQPRGTALRKFAQGSLHRAEAASNSFFAFCGDMLPSPSRSPDFFFACLGRGLFNCGLAGQVYLVYYLRDIIQVSHPIQVASLVAVGALVGGIVGALPAGVLSDRVGKKPIIYASIGVCVVSLLMFLLVSSVNTVQIIGFVYGIGNVGYLSVDYALGVQSLPSSSDGPSSDKRIDALCEAEEGAGGKTTKKRNENNNESELSSSSSDGDGDQNDNRAELYSTADRGDTSASYQNNTLDPHEAEGSTATMGDANSECAAMAENGVLAMASSAPNSPHRRRLTRLASRPGGTNGGRSPSSRGEFSRKVSLSKGAAHAGKDLGVFAMSATFGQVAGQLLFGTVLDQFAVTTWEHKHHHHQQIGATTRTPMGAPTTTQPPFTNDLQEVVRYSYFGFIVIYTLGAFAFVLSGVFTSYIKKVD